MQMYASTATLHGYKITACAKIFAVLSQGMLHKGKAASYGRFRIKNSTSDGSSHVQRVALQ
jgi:hypothetical protein